MNDESKSKLLNELYANALVEYRNSESKVAHIKALIELDGVKFEPTAMIEEQEKALPTIEDGETPTHIVWKICKYLAINITTRAVVDFWKENLGRDIPTNSHVAIMLAKLKKDGKIVRDETKRAFSNGYIFSVKQYTHGVEGRKCK